MIKAFEPTALGLEMAVLRATGPDLDAPIHRDEPTIKNTTPKVIPSTKNSILPRAPYRKWTKLLKT